MEIWSKNIKKKKKNYTDENKYDCEGMRDGYHDDDEDSLVRVSKIYVKHVWLYSLGLVCTVLESI